MKSKDQEMAIDLYNEREMNDENALNAFGSNIDDISLINSQKNRNSNSNSNLNLNFTRSKTGPRNNTIIVAKINSSTGGFNFKNSKKYKNDPQEPEGDVGVNHKRSGSISHKDNDHDIR